MIRQFSRKIEKQEISNFKNQKIQSVNDMGEFPYGGMTDRRSLREDGARIHEAGSATEGPFGKAKPYLPSGAGYPVGGRLQNKLNYKPGVLEYNFEKFNIKTRQENYDFEGAYGGKSDETPYYSNSRVTEGRTSSLQSTSTIKRHRRQRS